MSDLSERLRGAHDKLNCLATEGGFKTPETRDLEAKEAMALCWQAADALDAKDTALSSALAEAEREREVHQMTMRDNVQWQIDAETYKERAEAAEATIARLTGEQYAPGRWHCPKCKFTLLQSNLNAADGTVTARDQPGDKCPNCDSPLWRVSWKQEAYENLDNLERVWAEKRTAEAAIERLTRERDEARGSREGASYKIVALQTRAALADARAEAAEARIAKLEGAIQAAIDMLQDGQFEDDLLSDLEAALTHDQPQEPGAVVRCHAARDGECAWVGCPQARDGEPKATGRHCPRDTGDPYGLGVDVSTQEPKP